MNNSISVAIPHYNNEKFIIQILEQLKKVEIIDEIVILDDLSDNFNILLDYVNKSNDKRIKLYRNETNLGAITNKIKSLTHCKNEWAILFDSDNLFSDNFFDVIKNIELSEDTIYSPCVAHKIDELNNTWGGVNCTFDYSEYHFIDKSNFGSLSGQGNMRTLMNTCNFLVPVKNFLKCLEPVINEYDVREISSLDCVVFFCHWLSCGNKYKVERNLEYRHRVHPNSQYIKNLHLLNPDDWYDRLINKVK